MTTRNIAIRDSQEQDLVAATPSEQVAVMQEWARVLMDIVEKQKLYVGIDKKKYLEAEAWEIILSFANVGSQTEWVRSVEEAGEIVGYEAKVNLVKNGQVVGGAIMSCGLDEFPCKGKTGQAKAKAAKSAAQTWAMSKAARLKFSLVPILAGYAPTPAEEMERGPVSVGADSDNPVCPEHDTPWFKKGKMRNYAHPIENTGEWCNMPTEEEAPPPPSQHVTGAVPVAAVPPHFKDAGSMLLWAWNTHKLNRSKVLAIPGVDGDLKNGAYDRAAAKIAVHKEAP